MADSYEQGNENSVSKKLGEILTSWGTVSFSK